MPKLWTDTIEGHRREVREAILDATADLAAADGLLSMTMSRIAEQAGISRPTLYRYFTDVEEVLAAWHERQMTAHLTALAHIRDRRRSPGQRLEAVLTAYALMSYDAAAHHSGEMGAVLHRSEPFARAFERLHEMLRGLIADAAAVGEARDDIAADELAGYCLNATAGAAVLPSKAAVRRLVAVTLAGLRPTSAVSGNG